MKNFFTFAMGLALGAASVAFSSQAQSPPLGTPAAGVMGQEPYALVPVFKSGDISYHKDQKTGLCFAYLFSPTYAPGKNDYLVVSFTNIPCDRMPK